MFCRSLIHLMKIQVDLCNSVNFTMSSKNVEKTQNHFLKSCEAKTKCNSLRT